ncbi:MAG: Sir2 family NAD-dependent protein deacetylase [Myxococcales bacterium]|nr:Sir2 family NAD-dependent protein deacetylase [Myxococcales bacterium]
MSESLVALIAEAERLLIFTGAGISTGSGIPDYRGPQGVWKRRQPVYLQDFMASQEARVEYWDYKLEGWAAFRDAAPNATHRAVVDLERAGKIELVVTQNVDGLHSAAGTSDERLVEIHGSNRAVRCLDCEAEADPQATYDAFAKTQQPPRCSECDGWLKPATISFGQSLRQIDLERAAAGAAAADAVIALGSSLSVTPAANIPLMAAQRGAPYAIVNRGETEHDPLSVVTVRLDGDVGELFVAAVRQAIG